MVLIFFKLIEKLVPKFDEKRYQTAKALNNRHKNRHSNILAGESIFDKSFANSFSLYKYNNMYMNIAVSVGPFNMSFYKWFLNARKITDQPAPKNIGTFVRYINKKLLAYF